MIENQFETTIKGFQCDGGGESSKTEFLEHLSNCGIKQQSSCIQTPEQNGIAERKHCHFVETGLTKLINANILLYLWVESFSTT